MVSMNRTATTNNVDPFEAITITSSGFDEGYGVKEWSDYSLADAIHFGESRHEEAVGFSIRDVYIAFNRPMELNRAAWEVLTVVSGYGRVSGTTLDETIKIVAAYLGVNNDNGRSLVGTVDALDIVEQLQEEYLGFFPNFENFTAKFRDQYDWMDDALFNNHFRTYPGEFGDRYFRLFS